MKEFIYLLLTGTLGTLGFAALLHAPRRAWLPAGVLGGISYSVYWCLSNLLAVSDTGAMFLGCLLGTFLAQLCARRMKMIATIFVSLSIIPCVPGLGLYRAMSYLGQGDLSAGTHAAVTAMAEIMMIALAVGVSSFLITLPKQMKRRHVEETFGQ